jgi:hypothetical protein
MPDIRRNEPCFFGSITKGELCYAVLDQPLYTRADPFDTQNYFSCLSPTRRGPELVWATAFDAFAYLRSNHTTRLFASDIDPTADFS